MRHGSATQQSAISPYTGTFVDPAQERLFQETDLPRTAGAVKFMAIIGALFFNVAGVTDWMALTPGPDLYSVLFIRSLMLVPALAVFYIARTPGLGHWRNPAVSIFEFLYSTAFCLVITYHAEAIQFYLARVVIILLAFFLFIPGRFTATVLNGVYLAAAFIVTCAFYLDDVQASQLMLVSILLLACMVLAGFVLLRQQVMARREYLNLIELKRSNEQLLRESEQRREAQQQIEYRLQYEELITRLSTRLISVNGNQLNIEVDRTLEELGRFAQVDRSYIFEFNDADNTEACTHEWCAPGIEPAIAQMQGIPFERYSWSIKRLLRGQTLHVPSVAGLPPDANPEREEFKREAIKSLILIPLIFSRRVVGFIGFDSVHKEQEWSDDIIALLRIIGQMLVSALWRDRAEEALRASQARYERLAIMSPVGIFRTDARGQFTYVNERWSMITGLSQKQAMGQGWMQAIHPEDRQAVIDKWNDAIARHDNCRSEFRILLPDGSITWVLGQARMETLPDTAASGYVGSIDDITARKQAELALQERSRELEHANNALEKSNLDLQQFAYVASHDLQEPLRTISGFSKLIERRYKGQLDKDADELIEYLTQGVARLHNLISDLLNYSRLDTRAQPLQLLPLAESLQLGLTNLDAAIADSRASVTHDDLPILPVDPSLMMQLFQNLVGNAIKFRGSQPPRIHVSATLEDAEWIIRVSDNGIGIEQKHADQIFQIFKRLHSADKYPGTGIGLAVCKRIVERHGGRIWAEPNPGGGSVFCFTLPAPVSKSAAAA